MRGLSFRSMKFISMRLELASERYSEIAKESEPLSGEEIVIDFISEFTPMKLPTAIDFGISYLKEITKVN